MEVMAAVSLQLTSRGYIVDDIIRRNKSFDVLFSNPNSRNKMTLKVKINDKFVDKNEERSQLFGRSICSWIMNKKDESISNNNLFYCFIKVIGNSPGFRFFIIPGGVVADYLKEQHQLWLNTDPSRQDIDMRRLRIGFSNETYRIATPTIEQFENNWSFNNSSL